MDKNKAWEGSMSSFKVRCMKDSLLMVKELDMVELSIQMAPFLSEYLRMVYMRESRFSITTRIKS